MVENLYNNPIKDIPEPNKDWVTIGEWADFHSIRRNTAYQWILRGKLPQVRKRYGRYIIPKFSRPCTPPTPPMYGEDK